MVLCGWNVACVGKQGIIITEQAQFRIIVGHKSRVLYCACVYVCESEALLKAKSGFLES
jgi:hypothetical protein